ncbi:hypothetical protein P154DRAFT_249176 [Amniculicola lignicola CBS 123094]|uniref:Uncharacterized protein n=1 Tax=Amniculicola lignicola CBS 123094 TaxID=1392246 RepID=A0A6A5W8W5_9PLEO|nr:hypothetical protein P154DRAFT_249176 [Amniculicola lignicola CBS 123094]
MGDSPMQLLLAQYHATALASVILAIPWRPWLCTHVLWLSPEALFPVLCDRLRVCSRRYSLSSRAPLALSPVIFWFCMFASSLTLPTEALVPCLLVLSCLPRLFSSRQGMWCRLDSLLPRAELNERDASKVIYLYSM